MKPTPLLLGAIPLTIFTGALIGTAVATEPIARATDPIAEVPQHKVETRSTEEAQAMIAPRNHYPLKTPDGVIEVAELTYHGRMRHRLREQPLYGAQSEAEAFGAMEPAVIVSDEPHLAEARDLPENFVPLEPGVFENTARTAPKPADNTTQQAAAPGERTRFAQRDAELEGKARMIDVGSEIRTSR